MKQKLKNNKAILKRIKISKKGKVLRGKTGRRHLLSSKTTREKRELRRTKGIPKEIMKVVRHGLPYAI